VGLVVVAKIVGVGEGSLVVAIMVVASVSTGAAVVITSKGLGVGTVVDGEGVGFGVGS